MAERNIERFRAIVEDAVRQLIDTQHRADASYVRTPLLYPGGATVVVRVDGGPERFFVSDFGMGFDEAEMMGAATIYARHAPAIAERSGVKFDHYAFFLIEVARDRLPGAIVTIANCSQEAVSLAALKLAERTASDANERLYERLVSVFKKEAVERDAAVIGHSTTAHHVASLVTIGNRKTIFDSVSKHHVSVAHAAMKFQDIARLKKAPERIAVVRKKSEFGTYLAILAASANVIERDVPDHTIRKLAEVA